MNKYQIENLNEKKTPEKKGKTQNVAYRRAVKTQRDLLGFI